MKLYAFTCGWQTAPFRSVRPMRDRGVRMIYGHDPDAWAAVAKAPDPAA